MSTREIIGELRSVGVTLERVSDELDYREMAGIGENETNCGWDDDLYRYSGTELSAAEEMLTKGGI